VRSLLSLCLCSVSRFRPQGKTLVIRRRPSLLLRGSGSVPRVAAAQLVHRVSPSYQYLEPGTKLKGTVRLHAVIAEDGSVEQLEVISGHPLVVNAVMDAVKQWKYRPMLLNGEPVQVDTMVDVDYKIGIKKSGKS